MDVGRIWVAVVDGLFDRTLGFREESARITSPACLRKD
jgi:hypothetical protein